MDHLNIYTEEIEKLRKQEPDLLVKFVVENNSFCGKVCTPEERIALSIVRIMRLYEDMYRNYCYGGLVSTKHIYNTRITLTKTIKSEYSVDLLRDFVAFCVKCNDGCTSLLEADSCIRSMIDKFLSMRPAPVIHLRESFWKQIWEGDD